MLTKINFESQVKLSPMQGVCKLATTTNISFTGITTIDGVGLVNNDRILVWQQSLPEENGIYIVSGNTNLVRASDATNATDFKIGQQVFVYSGLTNGEKIFYLTTNVSTIGVSPIVYDVFAGLSGSSGTSGGTGSSGASGSSGSSGTSGTDGTSGSSGSSGTSALITTSETRPTPIDADKMCFWFDTTNKMPMVSYCINTSLIGAWSAGGALITARRFLAGAGTQNAGLAAGGYANANVSCTEEYNGTSWSAGGALITARRDTSGAGTQNAGLAAGGYTNANVSCTEEYNGTSWSSGGAMIEARRQLAGAGTQNAGLVVGGYANANVTCTEEYDGTSWSTGGALITARYGLAGLGTQNEGLVAGGYTSVNVACTE